MQTKHFKSTKHQHRERANSAAATVKSKTTKNKAFSAKQKLGEELCQEQEETQHKNFNICNDESLTFTGFFQEFALENHDYAKKAELHIPL